MVVYIYNWVLSQLKIVSTSHGHLTISMRQKKPRKTGYIAVTDKGMNPAMFFFWLGFAFCRIGHISTWWNHADFAWNCRQFCEKVFARMCFALMWIPLTSEFCSSSELWITIRSLSHGHFNTEETRYPFTSGVLKCKIPKWSFSSFLSNRPLVLNPPFAWMLLNIESGTLCFGPHLFCGPGGVPFCAFQADGIPYGGFLKWGDIPKWLIYHGKYPIENGWFTGVSAFQETSIWFTFIETLRVGQTLGPKNSYHHGCVWPSSLLASLNNAKVYMKIDVESSTIDCLESLAESQSEGRTGQGPRGENSAGSAGCFCNVFGNLKAGPRGSVVMTLYKQEKLVLETQTLRGAWYKLGVRPVIIHFSGIVHEINHPATLGYPQGNPHLVPDLRAGLFWRGHSCHPPWAKLPSVIIYHLVVSDSYRLYHYISPCLISESSSPIHHCPFSSLDELLSMVNTISHYIYILCIYIYYIMYIIYIYTSYMSLSISL